MSEQDKIVVERYPAEKLPEELRKMLGGTGPVRVTLEQEGNPAAQGSVPYGFARDMYGSQGLDPVDFVRQLRDEWE